ncbi:hypothetical protein Tco_0331077 [Tanacetum coccineum]
MKWYDYDYLEEIEVRREDQQQYKFKEGDFTRLHLHDIKDMLLLLVQRNSPILKKISFLTWVWHYRYLPYVVSDISKRIPYTAYNNLKGIIYEDKYNRNRLICTDELYNFSDGTLTSVRTVLHDIASNRRMYYFPKKRWTSLDKKGLAL